MVSKCIVFLAMCVVALRADFVAGMNAYTAGDYATALKEWQPLAEQGEPHCEYNLGLLYAQGLGVPKDFARAAEYYRKAAEQGIVAAEYNLGVLYSSGQGVPKDDTEASKWFLKAASQGDVHAAESLANVYAEGPGAFQNFAEAEKWYRKAAESGVAGAQFNLAMMYDIGQGVKQDFAEALKWYQKAAEQGYSAALCNIAILYYNGQGVPVDRFKAHEYFLIAKELGEPRAANLISLTTEKLTKKQILEASALADQWRAAHPLKAEEPLTPSIEAPAIASADDRKAVASVVAELPPPETQSVWTGVDRVIAVGDVHGDYDDLVAVLKSAKLIDDSANWIGGTTHLVQTGDILDRGGRSREVMDLLIKLQVQAAKSGGYVHCLLGNHEVMNLYGDLRYVSPGEYGAFRTENSAKVRDEEYAKSGTTGSREEWDKQHPLGYFEHRAAFSPDGLYGKWLRGLNTEIRINDTLFVHAGIGPKYVAMSLDEMNKRVREELNNSQKLQGGIVTDQEGPFWYRGLAEGEESSAEMTVVNATLENTGAKREAIGHTYAQGAITPRFDDKVILLDIGLPRVYDNIAKIGCLEIDGATVWALHRGHKLALPTDENGPDMLRYLKEAAALDPSPSPLAARIEKLSVKQ